MIVKGLKFTSYHFSAKAEIVEVREKEIDVMFIPSDGQAWIEKGLNLDHVKDCFERGEYVIYKENPADKLISIL